VGETVTRLAGVGIRSWQLGEADTAAAAAAAVEIERLGFSALWMPGVGYLERAAALVEATTTMVVASSVINIWDVPADEAAARWLDLPQRHRALLGIGVSHSEFVGGQVYASPLAAMARWLDALDTAGVPEEARIVAALQPRMLELAGARSLGSHPYLVTPEHTRSARQRLGPEAVLAPALVVLLEEDPGRARELGRRHLDTPYLKLASYVRSFLGQGFTPEELADGGTDRLVDAIVAWGSAAQIADRVREHLASGADHVALHVIGGDRHAFAVAEWRRLAEALDLVGDQDSVN
jgi:probable F420-dependent oxidoreductase